MRTIVLFSLLVLGVVAYNIHRQVNTEDELLTRVARSAESSSEEKNEKDSSSEGSKKVSGEKKEDDEDEKKEKKSEGNKEEEDDDDDKEEEKKVEKKQDKEEKDDDDDEEDSKKNEEKKNNNEEETELEGSGEGSGQLIESSPIRVARDSDKSSEEVEGSGADETFFPAKKEETESKEEQLIK